MVGGIVYPLDRVLMKDKECRICLIISLPELTIGATSFLVNSLRMNKKVQCAKLTSNSTTCLQFLHAINALSKKEHRHI